MDISGAYSSVAIATGTAQTGNTVDAIQQNKVQEVQESQPQAPVQPVEQSAAKSDGNSIDVYA